MKKTLMLILLLWAAAGLFAQTSGNEASADRQSIFSVGINMLLLIDQRGVGSVTTSETVGGTTTVEEVSLNHLGLLGIWAFLDARFVELSIGFLTGITHWVEETTETTGNTTVSETIDTGGIFSSLDFSAMLKFPIGLPTGYIFPLLGVGYNVVLNTVQRFGGGEEYSFSNTSQFNTFRIQAGIGMDYHIGGRREVRNWFVRVTILAHYIFAASHFQDAASAATSGSHDGHWGFSFLFGLGRGL